MTVGSTVAPEITWRDGLPPDEYWAIDPSKTIPTPVDGRGLIVVRELIEAAKGYICPEYEWDGPNDKHHLYYYASMYRWLETWSNGDIPAHQFRELAVNKIYIPRRFHNVLHRVMEPAATPDPEIMRGYIESWTVARSLFASVRKAVRVERRIRRRLNGEELSEEQEKVDQEIMEEVVRRHFSEVGRRLGALSQIPEEFRLIDPDADIRDSARRLGSVLLHGRQLRTRDVLLPSDKREPCTCLRCKVNRSIITPVNN